MGGEVCSLDEFVVVLAINILPVFSATRGLNWEEYCTKNRKEARAANYEGFSKNMEQYHYQNIATPENHRSIL